MPLQSMQYSLGTQELEITTHALEMILNASCIHLFYICLIILILIYFKVKSICKKVDKIK